jgi:hypothetical protein
LKSNCSQLPSDFVSIRSVVPAVPFRYDILSGPLQGFPLLHADLIPRFSGDRSIPSPDPFNEGVLKMRTTTKAPLILSCLILAVAFVGCSKGDRPPLAGVTGNVKIKGQPVKDLIIMFKPAKGKAGTGQTDAEGNYTAIFGRIGVTGAPVGKCKVSFQWPTGHDPMGVTIPDGWAGDSETEVEIKEGANTFNFNLE